MTRRLVLAAALAVIWAALWEDARPTTWVVGFVVGLGVVAAFPSGRGGGAHRVRPLAALRLLVTFSWKLVEASAIVSWAVLNPRSRIVEGVVAVPLRGASDGLTTLVANAISLTPGTLTLEVRRDPTVLYVHVLHLREPDAVRREVAELEALAIRAFGSEQAQVLVGKLPGLEALRPSQVTGGGTPHRREDR